MDMLHGLGTAVFFGLGWLIGIGVGLVVLHYALRPLDVPVVKGGRTSWEWIIAMFFALLYLQILGHALIVLICLVLCATSARQRRIKEGANTAKKPFFPRVALAELIAMVLSIGCAPLAFTLLYLEPVKDASVIVFLAAALLFPIAFLRAIQRLDGNEVPVGATRTAFLFLFPYMIYSCLFLCARATIVLLFIVIGEARSLEEIETNYLSKLFVRMLAAAVLFAAGVVLTRMARSASECVRSTSARPPPSMAPPLPPL